MKVFTNTCLPVSDKLASVHYAQGALKNKSFASADAPPHSGYPEIKVIVNAAGMHFLWNDPAIFAWDESLN